MARSLLCLLLWLVAPPSAFAISFDKYHSQEQIHLTLADLAARYPEILRLQTLGYSDQGRPIDIVTISMGDASERPAIYINGTHHGDEKASTESVLGIIDFLVRRNQDSHIKDLLESYSIYLQPIVNPDGHAANNRYDSNGVDLNRDYAYPGRTEEESFKAHSVRLIKSLMSRVRFRAAMAFHSGMEGVLWAWAHSPQPPPEADVFYTLSRIAAKAMGLERYKQSFADYPAKGEFIDYAYMTYGTLAVTVEVSEATSPPESELNGIVKRSVGGAVAFMLAIADLDHGALNISRNSSKTKDIISFNRSAIETRNRSL